MVVRYPSFARRKQVAKQRDRDMKAAVAASVGFVQEKRAPEPAREPLPEVFDPERVEIYDLPHFRHPGVTSAAAGPFLVACECGWRSSEIADYDTAVRVRGDHYRGEFS